MSKIRISASLQDPGGTIMAKLRVNAGEDQLTEYPAIDVAWYEAEQLIRKVFPQAEYERVGGEGDGLIDRDFDALAEMVQRAKREGVAEDTKKVILEVDKKSGDLYLWMTLQDDEVVAYGMGDIPETLGGD